MSIGQYIGILLLPCNTLGKVCPKLTVVDAVHQLIVIIELNHTRTANECTTEFAKNSIVISAVTGWRTKLSQHESMSHQCIDWTDWRVLNIVLINQTVAVCNPVLTVDAVVTNAAVVILLTPCSIGNLIPEWRSPSTYCSVEEDILAEVLTYITLETDDTLGVLVTCITCIRTYS